VNNYNAIWTDFNGNVRTLHVYVDERRVTLTTQNGVSLSPANVGFMCKGGTEAQGKQVRDAALSGIDRLREVTKLDWKLGFEKV